MCGFCNVWVCVCVGFVMCGCVCMCGFYNVWVCVCVGFIMCGFGCTFGFCNVWVCGFVCMCIVLQCVSVLAICSMYTVTLRLP